MTPTNPTPEQRIAQLEETLREIYALADKPSDTLTIGTYMHNIWLICRESGVALTPEGEQS